MVVGITRLRGRVPEGQHVTVAARVRGPDKRPIQPEDVLDWDLRVYDLNSATPNTTVYELEGQTSSLITPLVADEYWGLDAVGRNFLYRVERPLFGGLGGHTYYMVWTINTATHGPVAVDASVFIRPTRPGA